MTERGDQVNEVSDDTVEASKFTPSEPTIERLDEELTAAVAGKYGGAFVGSFNDGTAVLSAGAAVFVLKIIREHRARIAASPAPTIADNATVAPAPSSEGDGWQDIATAPKDGTRIWALFRSDIYPGLRPEREDLEPWNGVQAALRHPGVYTQDGREWDHGWNIAAPVGSGGFPDEWLVGWRHLPNPGAP